MRVHKAILTMGLVLFAFPVTAGEPRRTDHGDLILLDVYGSYREMGAQIGELLGEDGRRVLELNLGFYEQIRADGPGAWLFDRVVLPLFSVFMSGDTGVAEEAAGYAEALGISRADFLRAQIGSSTTGGSTVLAATRSATRNGDALLVRNVDWIDYGGLLKPTVVRYHPDNGDLDYVSAGWPLLQIPTVGINESGFAFSLNYFDTDPQSVPTSDSYPYRRVLQRATTVAEAIELFQSDFPIVLAAFAVFADAAGDIALLECTTVRCEVFRPEHDWFAHSNHARTEPMIDVDHYRGPDSFDRRRLMEEAFARHRGRLDARAGAEILRSRAGHNFPNASVVGNLFVLNAAIEGVRRAQNALLVQRDAERAGALWAEVFSHPPDSLDLSLLAIGWAWALVQGGDFENARDVLDTWVGSGASRYVRVHAALVGGVAADALGDRDAAVSRYDAAAALLEETPDYTSYGSLRALVEEGRRAGVEPSELDLSWWVTHVPP